MVVSLAQKKNKNAKKQLKKLNKKLKKQQKVACTALVLGDVTELRIAIAMARLQKAKQAKQNLKNKRQNAAAKRTGLGALFKAALADAESASKEFLGTL